MRETTSREFLEWQRYFEQELEQPTRQEMYLAQVAAEVRRRSAKKPNQVTLQQLILRFTYESSKKTPDHEARMAMSKARWLGMVRTASGAPPKEG